MRTTRRASLFTICLAFMLIIGACSGGGTPVSAGPGDNPNNYASSVGGSLYTDSGPLTSGHIFVYDLETMDLFNEANVSGNGDYSVGLNAGQYLVFGVSPNAWDRPAIGNKLSNYVNVIDGNDYRMDIKLTRALPAGEELAFGFVTSSGNGFPVVGATVSAADRSAKTDGYGFYILAVPAGTADFNVTANGFKDLSMNVRAGQASGSYFLTPFFNLNPTNQIGGSLGGIVRDVSDGSGLGGVRITLTNPEDPAFTPVQYLTNLGGRYRFYNLPEGIYKMLYERPGYASGTRDGLVLKDQDEAIINVFMNADTNERATVTGFVRNAGVPLPVSGARVSIADPLIGAKSATTNQTGFYTITGLVPGDYTITVTAPGAGVTFYESTSSFQTIFVGTNNLDFALRFINEGVLRGTVNIASGGGGPFGFPPTGVEVTAEKVGGQLTGVKWRTNTDGKGQFVFNGIPAGFYLVRGSIQFSSTENYYGDQGDVVVNAGTTTNIDLTLDLQ